MIQVKICGITQVEQAVAVAQAGADALGLIFYPRSPRHLEGNQAREIVDSVHLHMGSERPSMVGVFVNRSVNETIEIASAVGLDAVQLHGAESPQEVQQLVDQGLYVIKVLHTLGSDLVLQAQEYACAQGLMVEAGKGVLPGGNGASWMWKEAASLQEHGPFALAGGLDACNLTQAVHESGASAVDLSSGVEIRPGIKDLEKVQQVINKVRAITKIQVKGKVFP